MTHAGSFRHGAAGPTHIPRATTFLPQSDHTASGDRIAVWSSQAIQPHSSSGKAKPAVGVALSRLVGVTLRRARVPAIVDPAAAAQHAVDALAMTATHAQYTLPRPSTSSVGKQGR